MKKNFVMGVLVLAFGIIVFGCMSTGGSSEKPRLDGRWRHEWSNATGVIQLKDSSGGWNGIFVVVDVDGEKLDEGYVAVNSNGQITLERKKARYTVADVVINGKYLGEKLTIKGFWNTDTDFYKTNPAKNISLGGTSWKLRGDDDTTFVFKDDGTFSIELSTFVKQFNESWTDNPADTEGTYTIDGIKVKMNFPNGKRLNFSRTQDGGVGLGMKSEASHEVYVEGDSLWLNNVQLALVTE